jgi:DedD protein
MEEEKTGLNSKGWALPVMVGATLLTSLVIFYLGILVGQRIEGHRETRPEGPLLPIESDATPSSKADSADEVTFYDVLGKRRQDGEGGKASEAQVEGAKSASTPEGKDAKKTESQKQEATAPTTKESKTSEEAASSTLAWTVQVNAFEEEKDAEELVRRLKQKGLDAYVVSVDVRGKMWFRVRVGRFDSQDQAKKLESRLRSRERLRKAFATRIT